MDEQLMCEMPAQVVMVSAGSWWDSLTPTLVGAFAGAVAAFVLGLVMEAIKDQRARERAREERVFILRVKLAEFAANTAKLQNEVRLAHWRATITEGDWKGVTGALLPAPELEAVGQRVLLPVAEFLPELLNDVMFIHRQLRVLSRALSKLTKSIDSPMRGEDVDMFERGYAAQACAELKEKVQVPRLGDDDFMTRADEYRKDSDVLNVVE